MPNLKISELTRRHFIMGLQGLYPGRRWSGKEGIAQAIETLGFLQVDPLNVVARSHDIAMWGRVLQYRPADLDSLLYTDRRFFDYGGAVQIEPMAELPYWRTVMQRRTTHPRYLSFVAEHRSVMESVLEQIRQRGPLTSRDFVGTGPKHHPGGFRTGKDTGQALYHLWLTGEIMTHHRQGFDRVYDLRERIAPSQYQFAAPETEAEDFLARKVLVESGMTTPQRWRAGFSGLIERPVDVAEVAQRLASLEKTGEIVKIEVENNKDPYFVRGADFPLLKTLASGQIPPEWYPLETTIAEEAVFLAPLDMVSARGRAQILFGFDYIWEVYKPAHLRRWGYYILPVLYKDQLVARLDPKLDRPTSTLQLKGFWLENDALLDDPAFAVALARGLTHFSRFVGALHLDLTALPPSPLRSWLETITKK